MKPGDLVELVSGGPPMTILQRTADRGSAGWLCVWQVNGAARRAAFAEQTLRPCDPQRMVALPPVPARTRKVVDLEPLPDGAHGELLDLIDAPPHGGFDFSIICSGERWTVSVKLPGAGTHSIGEGGDFLEAWSNRKPAWGR